MTGDTCRQSAERTHGTAPRFDYASADRAAIAAHSTGLIGRRLGDFVAFPEFNDLPGASTKGVVGAAYEAWFGIPPNSRAGADFPAAGIELKSTPIIIEPDGFRAKERISLGMIDFAALAAEEWDRASVRKKLDNLLICFYRWRPDIPIGEFETLDVVLWRPTDEQEEVLRHDWEVVRDLVRQDRKGDVSEALGRWLGAATKGPGGALWSERRRRAWSLKPPFVSAIYAATRGSRTLVVTDVQQILGFEGRQLVRLGAWGGRTVAEIARGLGIEASTAKNAPASVVRRILGVPGRGKPADPEWIGVEIKTVPVSPAGAPWESMSFPAFRHLEVADQDWDDSDLLARLSRLLLVPLVRQNRVDPIMSARLGRARFWSPTVDQLAGIRVEWEMFRDAIRRGGSDQLPPASATRYIHVRPKDKRATPTDPAPGGLWLTRKCFWLNGDFVREILAAEPVLPRTL